MISISSSTLVAIFFILIGIFMIGFWSYAIISDIVPAEEKPWAITFHLFSEFSTSFLLIISGVGLWLNADWGKYLSLLALGMLLYIVIYSPGYYIQKDNFSNGYHLHHTHHLDDHGNYYGFQILLVIMIIFIILPLERNLGLF